MNYDYERQKRLSAILQQRMGSGGITNRIAAGGLPSGYGRFGSTPNTLRPVNSTDVLEALRRGFVPASFMGPNASPGMGNSTGQTELRDALSQFRSHQAPDPVSTVNQSTPDQPQPDAWLRANQDSLAATGQGNGVTPTLDQQRHIGWNRAWLMDA